MFFPHKTVHRSSACFAELHIIARNAKLTSQLSHNELQVEHGEWLVRRPFAVPPVDQHFMLFQMASLLLFSL